MSTPVPGPLERRRGTWSLLGRLALALAFASGSTVALEGCGPKEKKTKVKKPEPEPQGPTFEQVVAEARAAAQAGNADLADEKYYAALQLKPDAIVLEEHVDFQITHKRIESAVDNAKTFYDTHPTDARGAHVYAHALLAAGDFATALQIAEELIALDDGDAAAHEKKGRALVLGGQYDSGVEELRRAKELEPQNVRILTELGSALHRAGRVDEAALELRGAISLDPDNGRALMLLGMALRDQAEIEEALAFLIQATKKSSDARPWFELGITQNLQGDDMGAERSLQTAVEIDPYEALYWYAYGEMLRFNEKYDEAIEAYKRAAELVPPHPKATAKLGIALFEAKRYEEAEVFLTTAIRTDPANPYNYFNLGFVFKEQKKYKPAIEMFEKFLQLADKEDGDRPKASACVKNLKKKKPC